MNLDIKHTAITAILLIIVLGFFAWQAYEINQRQIIGPLNIESSGGVAEAVKRGGTWIIGIYFFSVIILSVAFWLTNRYFFKKGIEEILNLLKKMEDGDFSTRISNDRKDEIGMIVSSLNSLALKLNDYRDETERCDNERLQQIEKMASIGEVAEAVAHEIKNPLAGISGALQVIAEDIPDDSPRKEICKEILDEITRLDTTVKDLLFYTRPPEPNFVLADINAIIEKVKYAVRALAQKINVKINVISDNIPEVMIDPDQIEKALISIAHNSISSMPDGGTMTIVSYNKSQFNEVEIALSDTRKTMTEEDLKNVFKPKFATRHMGTGLGLAISKNIIEAHNGRIELENSFKAGSIFRVILPLRN
jgi:signal transduction histidine kinase